MVVGGGITGLSAAYQLKQDGIEVLLLEASGRIGGWVHSSEVGGVEVETGPDSFIARRPEMAELCRQLGLGDDLVTPSTSRAYIWVDAELHPIPAPSLLGVPLDAAAVAASGIVSAAGCEALRRGLEQASEPLNGDATVGEVLRPRIGDEVFERLVDPLLGGINAGSADELSLAAGAEPLFEAARASGPFGAALQAQLRARSRAQSQAGSRAQSQASTERASAGPIFYGLRGGAARAISALAGVLGRVVQLDTPALAIEREATRWSVSTPSGPVRARRLIMTAPAPVTAGLLAPHSRAAAEILGAIDYSDVVLVTFVADRERIEHNLDGSGFLVPRDQGLLMTACSWSSSKWQHLARSGKAVLRVSVGRSDDRRGLELEPGELVAALRAELAATIGLDQAAGASRLTPAPGSLPQYRPGHLDRVEALERHLAEDANGLIVTGAACRGLGLAACVAQGRAAARLVSVC